MLALATGARVSEAHALSRDKRLCKFVQDSHSDKVTLTVHTRPDFYAKNEKPQETKVPFVIKSLKHMFGKRDKERFLCPTRAVTVYISKRPDGPYPVSNTTMYTPSSDTWNKYKEECC